MPIDGKGFPFFTPGHLYDQEELDEAVRAEREHVLQAIDNQLAMRPWEHADETLDAIENVVRKFREE